MSALKVGGEVRRDGSNFRSYESFLIRNHIDNFVPPRPAQFASS